MFSLINLKSLSPSKQWRNIESLNFTLNITVQIIFPLLAQIISRRPRSISSWQQFLVPMCLQTKAISYRSVRLAYTKTYDNTSDLVFDSYYSRSPRPNTWYSIDPVFEPPSIDHHRMICLWLESWMSIGDRIYKLNQTSRPDISQETEQCTKDDRGLQTEDWQTSTMKQYWGNLIWQS